MTRNALNWTVSVGVVAILGMACGGDDDNNNNNGEDAGVEDVPLLTDAEGGMVLFEYINFDDAVAGIKGLPDGVTSVVRSVAHFKSTMTPELAPLPTPGACVNLYETGGWPLGQGTNSNYLDVGQVTISGVNAAGDPTEIAVPLASEDNVATFPLDDLGRPHDRFYQTILPGADDYQRPGSYFTVELSGSDEFPATTWEDTLYMPLHFEVTEPGLNDVPTLTAGEDFTVGWEFVPNPAAADTELLNAVTLVDAGTGSPVIFCVTLAEAETFTIPGDMITAFRDSVTANGGDPTNAVMLRNNITHLLERLPSDDPENKRRIDMLSVYCYAQLIATAAAEDDDEE